ncbi:MAG: glycine cleavage system protein GcvH [Polyangiales bacterium]
MADVPADLKYTKDHEWARVDGDRVVVGITQHAVEALGDVTLVGVDVKVGAALTAGKPFGTVESVKAVSDLFAPVDGTLVEVNPELQNSPERVNESPYDAGWMVVIQVRDAGALSDLLDADAYAAYLGTL